MGSSDWKVKSISDICINFDAKRIPISSIERNSRKGSYPYYGAQGIIDYIDDYIFEGEYLLIAEDGANLETRNQDICMLTPKGHRFWVNNHAHILKANHLSDIRYIKYFLNNFNISPYITGSAQPKLNQENLGKITLLLPSISEQRYIANILSSLDDKIELNNKINKNLEEIAQTLYKRWFVEFEFPNDNGGPYKSSGGEMVDSELGMIPKGWEVQGYNNIFEITYGKSKYSSKEKTIIGKYHVYGAGGIVSKTDNYDYELQQVIVGCRGTCGQVSLTKPKSKITHNSLVLNQKTKDPYYHFLLAKNNDLKPFITGSTQPQITINDLNKCCSVQSDKSTIDRFNHFVSPIFQKILMNEKESFLITKIRDELLPKLMSGEIEVPVEE